MESESEYTEPGASDGEGAAEARTDHKDPGAVRRAVAEVLHSVAALPGA